MDYSGKLREEFYVAETEFGLLHLFFFGVYTRNINTAHKIFLNDYEDFEEVVSIFKKKAQGVPFEIKKITNVIKRKEVLIATVE